MPQSSSPWFDYLDAMHHRLFEDHPEMAEAIAAAREWDSPLTFLSASWMANAKPAELERLVLRALIMLNLPPQERQALIEEEKVKQKAAWAKQGKAAAARAERERSQRPPPGGFVEVDLSEIQL